MDSPGSPQPTRPSLLIRIPGSSAKAPGPDVLKVSRLIATGQQALYQAAARVPSLDSQACALRRTYRPSWGTGGSSSAAWDLSVAAGTPRPPPRSRTYWAAIPGRSQVAPGRPDLRPMREAVAPGKPDDALPPDQRGTSTSLYQLGPRFRAADVAAVACDGPRHFRRPRLRPPAPPRRPRGVRSRAGRGGEYEGPGAVSGAAGSGQGLLSLDWTSPRSRVSPGLSTTRSITTPISSLGRFLTDCVAGILLAGDQTLDAESALLVGLQAAGQESSGRIDRGRFPVGGPQIDPRPRLALSVDQPAGDRAPGLEFDRVGFGFVAPRDERTRRASWRRGGR